MNWANYLIQINLYLMLFYGFYLVFLKNETFFTLNRIYLVGSAFFSALIPMLQTEWTKSLFITEKVQDSWQNVNLLMMQGFASPIQEESKWALGDFLILIYTATVLILCIRLAFKFYGVHKMFKSEKHPEAFSFFRTIKVNENLPQKAQIEKHELTHAKQLHSVDVMFFEILSIINWFNPIVYFYKKSIRNIHEFIADEEAVLYQNNKKEYALLLFSKSFGINPNSITNNFFNQSLLKRRIQMLQKPKSRKSAILKYGLSVPLFLLAIILSSAAISENKKIELISKEIAPNGSMIKQIPSILNTLAFTDQKLETLKDSDQVYKNVDQLPTFPGGLEAFGKFLTANLKYPVEAKNNNIQGRVYLTYVVEKDGSLSTIKIVRGIGFGCDEEALRVMKLSPNWKPGQQNGKVVKVSYTVPIFFQLKGKTAPPPPPKIGLVPPPPPAPKNEVIPPPPAPIEISSSNKALFMIDGIEYKGNKEELNKNLNPDLIKSINVLKGEKAIEKYGEKGKDGVIEITTKKEN